MANLSKEEEKNAIIELVKEISKDFKKKHGFDLAVAIQGEHGTVVAITQNFTAKSMDTVEESFKDKLFDDSIKRLLGKLDKSFVSKIKTDFEAYEKAMKN